MITIDLRQRGHCTLLEKEEKLVTSMFSFFKNTFSNFSGINFTILAIFENVLSLEEPKI